MRTVNETLVDHYADEIIPLLPLARRAYGTQQQGSPTREASDRVNELILEYVDEKGGNITHLATELKDHGLAYAGVRRRLRAARGGRVLGQNPLATAGRVRGSRDPVQVQRAVDKITAARDRSPDAYGRAVADVYASGVALAAVAKEMGVSYFTLWAAMNS